MHTIKHILNYDPIDLLLSHTWSLRKICMSLKLQQSNRCVNVLLFGTWIMSIMVVWFWLNSSSVFLPKSFPILFSFRHSAPNQTTHHINPNYSVNSCFIRKFPLLILSRMNLSLSLSIFQNSFLLISIPFFFVIWIMILFFFLYFKIQMNIMMLHPSNRIEKEKKNEIVELVYKI